MSMLFFLIFAAPIHLVWHPQVTDQFGNCIAEPGSFAAVYCSGITPVQPIHGSRGRVLVMKTGLPTHRGRVGR